MTATMPRISVFPAFAPTRQPLPCEKDLHPPRWFELLQERLAAREAAVRARPKLLRLDQLCQAIGSLRCMLGIPGELRLRVASILINIGDLRLARHGDILMRMHDRTSDTGFVLLRGTARITRDEMPDGLCPAPELMGETIQFSPLHERSATVTANEDCIVILFTWREFWTRVRQACTEPEQRCIRAVLEDLAWDHLTRPLPIPPDTTQA